MFIIHVKEVKKMRMKVEFATSRFPRYYNVLGVSLIKEAIKNQAKIIIKIYIFTKIRAIKLVRTLHILLYQRV